MSGTPHYTPEEWADFTRNVAPPEARAAMKKHLDRGCRSCADLHGAFARVHALAAADSHFEPPPATLRLAKALFALRAPERRVGTLASFATLLFDSRLMPAPMGLRNVPLGPRKFLFASGDMIIDLQVTPASDRTVMVGQLTMSSHLNGRVAGIPALLHRGLERIAGATTNNLGEFEMEFEGPADELSLALGSEPDATVISLGTFTRNRS